MYRTQTLAGDVRIDPAQVSDCDYDLACAVLYSSISRALADPALRREYEEWKEQEAARQGRKERR